MPRSIRFHLDESCDPRIAFGLRLLGIDITLSHEVGLLQASDDEQIKYIVREGRVLVSQDADFLRLAASGLKHPGIVFYSDQSRRIGYIIKMIHLLWEVCEPEEMKDRIEFF